MAWGWRRGKFQEQIEEIYGFKASAQCLDITDKILPEIEEWQNRPLASVYRLFI